MLIVLYFALTITLFAIAYTIGSPFLLLLSFAVLVLGFPAAVIASRKQ